VSKLSYNTRLIFESDQDENSVMEMLSWQQLAFNECSKVIFDLKKKSIIDVHKAFYGDFRKSQEKIPSQVVIAAQRECLARYKSVKSNKHKIKSPISKKNLSIQLDKRIYSVKGDVLSIISSNGRVKCKPYIYEKLSQFYGKYKLCDPSLYIKDGEIWIGLVFDLPDVIHEQTLATGIDLGVRQFAVSSEGVVYDDKKFKKEKRRLRYLKRCLQGRASKGSRSAKKHLNKLKRKEANKNKDFIHKTASDIVKSVKGDVIAVENLKGIKKKKHKGQNKNAISQVPLFDFVQKLEYKAPKYGRTVIKVDPRFTSQVDHSTGKKDGKRQGRRYYSKTGKVFDAEINAAINIARRTQHPVSFVEPLDGSLKPYRAGQSQQPKRNVILDSLRV
jgi:IS605 OrfB family transposase